MCEEVRLSRIFLRGGWFDIGVDESQEKEGEKSLFPFCFCVLLGLTNQCCYGGMRVCERIARVFWRCSMV